MARRPRRIHKSKLYEVTLETFQARELGGSPGTLAEVPGKQAPDRQVLVELGPVEPEGRKLDRRQRLGTRTLEPRIAIDRKRELEPVLQADLNAPVLVARLHGSIC